MRKNKLLIKFCLLMMMVSCALGIATVGANAAMEAPSFELTPSASIRVADPAGIRFQTKVLKTEYAKMAEKNAEYGTLIIPEVALGSNELTVSVDEQGKLSTAANVLIVKAENVNKSVEDDKATAEDESLYVYYNAVVVGEKQGEQFTGLPKEFYGMNLVARSYVVYDGENGKEVEYAENTATRSLATVAKYIIIEDSDKYDTTEYAYFHDITDYVALENALSAVTVNKAADEPTCEVALEGDEVKAVYVLGEDEQVKPASWTYADGKFAFTANYFNSLANGEYTYKLLTENSVRSLTLKITEEYAATPAIEDGYSFETNAVLSEMVYDGVVNGNANHQGIISKMKYADEGVSAPENGNKYGVKITSSKQYLVFRLNFGKALSAGDVVSFKVYFVQPQDVTVNIPLNASSELNNVRKSCKRTYTTLTGESTNFGYGKWFVANFTLVQVNSADPTSMWVNLTYPSGAAYTGLTMYIDDVNVKPTIEDGYNFETNAVLSDMVYSGVLNAGTQSGTISRVKYADEGITATSTANKYGVKVVADAGKSALVFRINFGKQLSTGDKVSFNIYVKTPASVTDATKLMRLNGKSEYTATTATRGGNMTRVYSGASTSFKYETWLTCTFTLTQVNENDPNGIWVGMEYPTGITNYTGVVAYIDNVMLTKAN